MSWSPSQPNFGEVFVQKVQSASTRRFECQYTWAGNIWFMYVNMLIRNGFTEARSFSSPSTLAAPPKNDPLSSWRTCNCNVILCLGQALQNSISSYVSRLHCACLCIHFSVYEAFLDFFWKAPKRLSTQMWSTPADANFFPINRLVSLGEMKGSLVWLLLFLLNLYRTYSGICSPSLVIWLKPRTFFFWNHAKGCQTKSRQSEVDKWVWEKETPWKSCLTKQE